jgi:hypothetical protein
MRRNTPSSNSPFPRKKKELFTSRIVIIHSRLTVDYMHAGSSLAAALACESDFAKAPLLEFWPP